MQIHFPTDTVLLDGSFTHPCSKSYAPIAATTPLSAAARREHEKHLKYDTIAAEEKSLFISFVMESFGGYGNEALTFLNRLSRDHRALSLTPAPSRLFSSLIFQTLSIGLQKANALILLTGCRVARQFSGEQVGFPVY